MDEGHKREVINSHCYGQSIMFYLIEAMNDEKYGWCGKIILYHDILIKLLKDGLHPMNTPSYTDIYKLLGYKNVVNIRPC